MAVTPQRSDEFVQLEAAIRDNAANRQPTMTTLATSDRIIARVTDGIYREPWAAFRELVANAYDADASYVVIETGQPDFSRITVRDDGIGMSPKTLAYILTNIGGSTKRTAAGADFSTVDPNAPDVSPGGRPLIGKIGIGMFAVAQLTQHFQIITKAPGERHRLSATVRASHSRRGRTPEKGGRLRSWGSCHSLRRSSGVRKSLARNVCCPLSVAQ